MAEISTGEHTEEHGHSTDGEEDEAQSKSELGRYDYKDPAIWTDQTHRRAILAALVTDVYEMEKRRKKRQDLDSGEVMWKSFGYRLDRPVLDDNGTGSVIAAVFHYDGPLQAEAPKVVVAMRGTLARVADLVADIDIAFFRLSGNDRFHTALKVVEQEVARSGPSGVCLSGHSKGASLALLVGRRMAEEGVFLECHLFNPPSPTLPPTILPATLSTLGPLFGAADVVHNMVANGLAEALVDPAKSRHDDHKFLLIAPWYPTLYVNRHDPISAAYINYFDLQQHLIPKLKAKSRHLGQAISSVPRSIRAVLHTVAGLPNHRPDHLIPSAHLVVNSSHDRKWRLANPRSMYSAHCLKQWLDPRLQLRPVKFSFDADEDCTTSADANQHSTDGHHRISRRREVLSGIKNIIKGHHGAGASGP